MKKQIFISLMLTIICLFATNKLWLVFKPMPVSFNMFGNGTYKISVVLNEKDNNEFKKIKEASKEIELANEENKIEIKVKRAKFPKRLKLVIMHDTTAGGGQTLYVSDFQLNKEKLKFTSEKDFSVKNATIKVADNKLYINPINNEKIEIIYKTPLDVRCAISFKFHMFLFFLVLPVLLIYGVRDYRNKFIYLLLFLIIVFLASCTLDGDQKAFNLFISNAGKLDYFADFINQVRLTYDDSVYLGEEWTLAERALPPLQYVILSLISKFTNFNDFPTLFLNGNSLSVELSEPIYISTYFMCAISILFFIVLYENLKLENKVLKLLVIFGLIFSFPFACEFQRGNIVLLASLATTIFLFNYKSSNKINFALSLFSLAFAMALKPLPSLFLILFLPEKRYKDILKVILMCIMLTIISFLCLKGGISNIPLYIKNMQLHQNVYHYVHVKFTFIYILLYIFCLFYKEEWKRNFIISLLIFICVPRGYYYLFMLPVVVMFFNENTYTKWNILYGVLLIAIITPLQIFNAINIAYVSGILLATELLYTQIPVICKKLELTKK